MSRFRLREFEIQQQRCAHRVGTDALLLGAWVRPGSGRMLDIGTGTGILALMLAQRAPRSLIEGIEPHRESFLEAQQNIARSPWPGIQIFQSLLQDWQATAPYDLLVCNPPYFVETVNKAAWQARQNARHTQSLSHQELLQHSLRLLAPSGRLALILPLEYAQLLLQNLPAGVYLQRQALVRHSLTHPHKRMLMELAKAPCPLEHELEHEEICLRNLDGSYSPAYRALIAAFQPDDWDIGSTLPEA